MYILENAILQSLDSTESGQYSNHSISQNERLPFFQSMVILLLPLQVIL